MTADQALLELWRECRDDARHISVFTACINFAYETGALSLEQRALWLLRTTTCPGHDDEGDRSWCAYCGDMPRKIH